MEALVPRDVFTLSNVVTVIPAAAALLSVTLLVADPLTADTLSAVPDTVTVASLALEVAITSPLVMPSALTTSPAITVAVPEVTVVVVTPISVLESKLEIELALILPELTVPAELSIETFPAELPFKPLKILPEFTIETSPPKLLKEPPNKPPVTSPELFTVSVLSSFPKLPRKSNLLKLVIFPIASSAPISPSFMTEIAPLFSPAKKGKTNTLPPPVTSASSSNVRSRSGSGFALISAFTAPGVVGPEMVTSPAKAGTADSMAIAGTEAERSKLRLILSKFFICLALPNTALAGPI